MALDRKHELAAFDIGDADAVLDALVRRSGECIHMLDLDGRVVRWNAACERVYGWQARAVLGRVVPFAASSMRTRVIRDVRMLAASETVTEREGTFVRPDDSRVRVRMSVIPISDADGDACGVAVVSREILSDERLERQRDEFAGYVARGLVGPLNVIANAAALLQHPEVAQDAGRRARLVGAIRAQARCASEFVDDLQTMALIAKGELLLDREPADLTEVASGAVAALGTDARRVVVDFDPEIEPIPVDSKRISRAIETLVRVALQSGSDCNRAFVSVVRDRERIVIRVRSLSEVPEESAAADEIGPTQGYGDETSRDGGIPLSLARGIIEAHGGTMVVEPADAGGGTVEVSLPVDGRFVPPDGRTRLD